MNNLEYAKEFELKKVDDMTQNLYIKCYQNNVPIIETDLGNIEDIFYSFKKIDNLIKYLKDKIKENQKYLKNKHKHCNEEHYCGIDCECANWNIRIYQDILEKVKSGKYE